jgi:hypothetical protein
METELPRRRVTIADVAARASVSPAAVSKVLRNAYGVSPDMRARVRQAMTDLKYRPHAAARGMRGQTYTIGVMLPEIRNPFFPDIIDGVTEQLGGTDYQVLIGAGGGDPDSNARVTDAMIDRRMDGLILVGPLIRQRQLEDTARTVPTVVIGRHGKSASYDAVVDDDIMTWTTAASPTSGTRTPAAAGPPPCRTTCVPRGTGKRCGNAAWRARSTWFPRRTASGVDTSAPASCCPDRYRPPPSSPAPTWPPSAC